MSNKLPVLLFGMASVMEGAFIAMEWWSSMFLELIPLLFFWFWATEPSVPEQETTSGDARL